MGKGKGGSMGDYVGKGIGWIMGDRRERVKEGVSVIMW